MEQLWIWQSCLNKHFHTRVPTSNISSMSSRSDIRIFFSWKKRYFSPESLCFSSRLLDRRIDFLLSTVHVLRVTESFWTTERSRNSWIFKSFHSVVKRKHSHSKKPHEWQWTLRRAAFRETGNWTSLSVASERNWGEGVCIVGSWVASGKSFPVAAGWREEMGWHFRLQKRVFQACFVVVVILVFVCSFALKLSWCIRRLGTNIRPCLEQMRWQQNPLWFLMVTREILSWFVVGSLCTPIYPSPPKFQFNLENVSNQWWAPGWGLLEIQSL